LAQPQLSDRRRATDLAQRAPAAFCLDRAPAEEPHPAKPASAGRPDFLRPGAREPARRQANERPTRWVTGGFRRHRRGRPAAGTQTGVQHPVGDGTAPPRSPCFAASRSSRSASPWRSAGLRAVPLSGMVHAASRPSASQVSAVASAVTPGMVDIRITLSDPQMRGDARASCSAPKAKCSPTTTSSTGRPPSRSPTWQRPALPGQRRGLRPQPRYRSRDVDRRDRAADDPAGDSSRLKIGEGVVALGNAQGRGGAPSAAAGSLVALDRRVIAEDKGGGNPERLSGPDRVDAAVQPGDSGGPLADAAGQTIGITTAATNTQSAFGRLSGLCHPHPASALGRHAGHDGKPSAGVHIGPTAFLGVGLVAGGAKGAAQPCGALRSQVS